MKKLWSINSSIISRVFTQIKSIFCVCKCGRKWRQSEYGIIDYMTKIVILGAFFVAISRCTNPYHQGFTLYENYCSNCHMSDGSGLAELIPPLKDADYLVQNKHLIPCIIRYGIRDTLRVNGILYYQEMIGIPELNEVEITNIINYILNRWYKGEEKMKVNEVSILLKNCSAERPLSH